MYDFVLYIGRFQPFHDGHNITSQKALKLGKNVIFGVGSANRSRSTENPWTYDERCTMIDAATGFKDNVYFIPINDYPYNDTAWIVHVNTEVNNLIQDLSGEDPSKFKIALIGFKKDESSRYLDFFPQWDFIGDDEQVGIMSATDVREAYFQKLPVISDHVPEPVRILMKSFMLQPEFKWLYNEFEYIREYPKLWGKGPFVTVDAVVEQMGHILLVTRKEAPFKGRLAIPGGFVNLNEWIAKARVRELKEETRLADNQGEIPPAKLMSFMVKEKIYDDPKRSARGRVITHAGLFKLPSAKQLYKVVGADDAEKAAWYDFSKLDASMFMEDHYFIIQDMLGMAVI